MARQFSLSDLTLYSQDYLSHPQRYSNHLQIMSCSDLDMDSLFHDFNSHSLNSSYNAILNPTENSDTYLINYDIYGKMVLDSPSDSLQDINDETRDTETESNNGFLPSHEIIEEKEDFPERSQDKENLVASLPTALEYVRRRRAQSDSFGIPSETSLGRSLKRAPLKDITPPLTKKIKLPQTHLVTFII